MVVKIVLGSQNPKQIFLKKMFEGQPGVTWCPYKLLIAIGKPWEFIFPLTT
jgi:hypothetical protein